MKAAGLYYLGPGDRQPSDGLADLMSNNNAVTKPTTSGYAWRACSWPYLDTHGLASVQKAFKRGASIGKPITMCIRVQQVPDRIVSAVRNIAGQTFTTELSGGMGKVVTVVPWCEIAIVAYKDFLNKLANYDSDGRGTRLADNPWLAGIRVSALGMKHPGRDVEDYYGKMPGYTRKRYIAATIRAIGLVRTAFPKTDLFGGVFRTRDNVASPVLSTALIDAIAAHFHGFGLFQELWMETQPAGNNLADLRYGMSKGLQVCLQELDSGGNLTKRLAYADRMFGDGYRECYPQKL